MTAARRIARLALGAVVIAACGTGARPGVAPGKLPEQAAPAIPLAEVLRVERVRLATPVSRRIAGQTVAVNEFVIVYVHLASTERWLGRNAPGERLMVGTVPTEPLAPLVEGAAVPLAVPMTGTPLEQATLWAVPALVSARELAGDSLTVLARLAARGGAGLSVPLGPALARQGPIEVTTVRTTDELRARARATSATIQVTPR